MAARPAGDDLLILDGATGTELDRRGVDVSLPLWSARALLDGGQAVLAAIHRDYLEAGAAAITANTFRTHRRTLAKAGLGERAAELTRTAVEVARRVRDEVNPEALVLGSVAPLEDCYRPDLAPGAAECRTEHAEMIANLLEAGADRILIETVNGLTEARAAAQAARELAGAGRWMISFCTRSDGAAGVLLSGEPLEGLLEELTGAWSVGVNCVAAPAVEAQIRFLRNRVRGPRLSAYANIGHADPQGNWIATDAADPGRYAALARRWIEAGATIVGGCCGTTPQTIRALAERN